ncbi:MAG: hypothetical protein ACP5IB_06620 [Thermoplasmata archaeon]
MTEIIYLDMWITLDEFTKFLRELEENGKRFIIDYLHAFGLIRITVF